MKIKTLATIAAVLFISAAPIACKKKAPGVPEVPRMTAMEAAGNLSNDFAVLVDVREVAEIQGGMAQGAQWIPMSSVNSEDAIWKTFVEKLPKDKQIVFYCAKGGRSQAAAEKLASQGYKTANMGGYEDWVAAGLPTQKPPMQPAQ